MGEIEKRKYLLQDLLDMLEIRSPRDQIIIKFRLGIPNDREFTQFERNLTLDEIHNHIQCESHTLEETSKEFGLTIERIRQIERRFMYRVSHLTRRRKLKDYLEC